MADAILDGDLITSEADVHRSLAIQLDFGPYYGQNIAALRDRLSTDVPRPVRVTWLNSRRSRRVLGSEVFESILEVFEDVSAQDRKFGWSDRFEFVLR